MSFSKVMATDTDLGVICIRFAFKALGPDEMT